MHPNNTPPPPTATKIPPIVLFFQAEDGIRDTSVTGVQTCALPISELEIGDIKKIAEVYERCTKMHIDPRHPYAGKLVFTAFSGSHQDAINKGMHVLMERKSEIWQVPYLPIDPSDIGREYEPVVRINSQSGKGGVAFVMDSFFGFKLPRGMHKEFADVIQKIAEKQGEVAPEQIMEEFRIEYLDRKEPYHFRKCKTTDFESGDQFTTVAVVTYSNHGETKQFEGVGNGPIDAVKRGLEEELGISIKVLDYSEHALTSGSGAQAASYIHLMDQKTGKVTYGVGISSNITRASLRGIFSAVNRLFGDAEKNVGYTFSAAVRHREKLQCPAANHKKILNAAEMGMQSCFCRIFASYF